MNFSIGVDLGSIFTVTTSPHFTFVNVTVPGLIALNVTVLHPASVDPLTNCIV